MVRFKNSEFGRQNTVRPRQAVLGRATGGGNKTRLLLTINYCWIVRGLERAALKIIPVCHLG